MKKLKVREGIYMASGEVHNYLNGIKIIMRINKKLRAKRGRWTLFAKIKLMRN